MLSGDRSSERNLQTTGTHYERAIEEPTGPVPGQPKKSTQKRHVTRTNWIVGSRIEKRKPRKKRRLTG